MSPPPSLPVVVFTREVVGETHVPGARVLVGPPELRPRSEVLASIRGAHVVGSMFNDRVDAEFLDAAGPQLRGVCNYAVGVDNFDLPECARRKVIVTNTPDAVTEGTANLAWGLILNSTRMLALGDRFCRSGRFEHEGNAFPRGWLGLHLTGQRLLIVGAGRIGLAVATRALAFGMRVDYVARSRHMEFEIAPLAARHVGLDEGLASADVVSLHCPLTPATRHLIDARRLALLKPTAVLINTARGPVVDEAALVEALRHKRLWGAGLDVFEDEPKIHPGLRTLDNVVMTPHIGSAERYWREQMTRMVCDNAAAILAGLPPPNHVSD